METLPFDISSPINLKEIGKRRILEQMIRRVNMSKQTMEDFTKSQTIDPKFYIMLVDSSSLKIMSSFCNVYDLFDEDVIVIEDIKKKRQSMPNNEAIYFISPRIESVNLLCEDFKNESNPKYKFVHVFFTLPIENDLIFQTVAACTGLLKKLKNFVEFNLGFIAYERRVFHLDSINPITQIFPSNNPEALSCVNQLFSLFLTLGDIPNIRFHSNHFSFCESIAALLFQRLMNCNSTTLTKGRTLFLIVDRSIDLPPLFLHEYTYQAYIYDMLGVPLRSADPHNTDTSTENTKIHSEKRRPSTAPLADTVAYCSINSTEKDKVSTALLNENDTVYEKYKHQHLMVALKKIPQEIKKLLQENSAASFQNKPEMTNEEMSAAIRHLPDFQQAFEKLNVHHSITQRCLEEFNAKQLNKVGQLEQDLATGVTKKGKRISAKKCVLNIVSLLDNENFGEEIKIRLLLLCFSMLTGMSKEDKQKIIQSAGLSLENKICLRNFDKLGLTQEMMSNGNANEFCHVYTLNQKRLRFYSATAKATDLELSRFQPYLMDIIEQLIDDTLSRGNFPYVSENFCKDAAQSPAYVKDSGSEQSTKAKNKLWDFNDDSDETSFITRSNSTPIPSERAPRPSGQGPVVVLFVLGGITFSESRVAYEISQRLGCEVLIGGSCLVTPRDVIKQLKDNEFMQV